MPFSGEQFVLDDGRVRVEIGAVAAVLREVRVRGTRITETVPLDATPPNGCGIVLTPWPNRVRDGRWTLEGETMQLDLTEPKSGSASHGLLRNTAYRLREQTADAVTLGALVAPQHGWPFTLDTWVTYRLEEDGIAVMHGVHNVGAARAPWAVGAHPYFRVGETPIEELTLTLLGTSTLDLDDRLLPVGESSVEGTEHDLREGRRVGDLDLNAAYRLPELVAERTDVAWLDAPDGARTTVWHGPEFGWSQAFTPRDFARAVDGAEGEKAQGLAVALEPMTAAPDALNSGDGLVWLEPGEHRHVSWGVRYTEGGAR